MMDRREGIEQTPLLGEKFFLVVLLLLVFAMAARTPLDTDMWWHLRAGEGTWLSRVPMMVDTFSYTRYGETWINHSWLSQVGIYLLFRVGGYPALALAVAILATLSMALVYLQMQGHPLLRGFVLVLASAVAAKVWSPRPQLVSLVLFGLVGYILYLFKWRKRDHLWLLPLIFVLWSNLHGGYVLGLLLLATMIGGEGLNHLLAIDRSEKVSGKGIRRILLWGLVSAFVVVINPNGIGMWLIPFRTVGVESLQNYVSEWASPDFHDLTQQPFLWMLLGILGLAGISRRRLDGTDLVSVAGFAYLAFLARRNFGPFAMVAAPLVSRQLVTLYDENRELIWSYRDRFLQPGWLSRMNRKQNGMSPGVIKILNSFVIGILILACGLKLYAVSSPEAIGTYMQDMFPQGAVSWIEANQPSGHLFNSYNWGGYLIWALRDYPVYVDGRTDLYDDDLLKEYKHITNAEDGWEKVLGRRQINLVLVEMDSGLEKALRLDAAWTERYRDGQSVVYTRSDLISVNR